MFRGILIIVATIVTLWSAVFLPSFFTRTYTPENVPISSSSPQATSSTKTLTEKVQPKPAPTPRKIETLNGALATTREATSSTVVTPGPLRVVEKTAVVSGISYTLSSGGVLAFTNKARADVAGLPPLIRNETLDRAAQIKLDDMFSKQYFEHISPVGVGPADLAKTIGYAYVVVGENLALGNFENDEKLVDAWMESPGHRANILNTHYREIGIAVGKGFYEGKETWLAVQSFGIPLSVCPATDAQMKTQIENNNTEITRVKSLIDAKKAEIDGTSPYDPAYNMLVSEYNTLISPYNTLVEQTRILVSSYNTSVQKFNECIVEAGGSDSGH